ncbi:hypothetical protein [Brasilonema sp. UFV-L1]|uniref:hypothetical protein n=1 Tax=Brasilonema sp. UFV-L1 TaxID=2234130 RepID=UPI00145CBEE4|nr:hypothetical protein [Brasilonema sp. UFV-L1]NMG06282.1 hypothetical protein [Brasilonema sp. UFV-L1]
MSTRELNELLLKNPVLIGIFTGTIGAFIGAVITILNTLLSNVFQERREKQQTFRENLQQLYRDSLSVLAWFSQLGKCQSLVVSELREKIEVLIINFDFLSIYYLTDTRFPNLISLKESLVDLVENLCCSTAQTEELGITLSKADVKEVREMSRQLTNQLIKLASEDSRFS